MGLNLDLRFDDNDGDGGGLPKTVNNFICPGPCPCIFCSCFCRFNEEVSAVNFRLGVEVRFEEVEAVLSNDEDEDGVSLWLGDCDALGGSCGSVSRWARDAVLV